jgi:hypothetical protein
MENTLLIRKAKKDELKRGRFLKGPSVCSDLVVQKNPTDSTADTDLSDGGNSVEPISNKRIRLNSTTETVTMVMSRLREATSQHSNAVANALSTKETIDIVKDVRRLMSDQKDPPIAMLLAHGLLPYLTSLMRNHRHPTLLYEIIWCFINVSSSLVPSHVEAVVSSGIVIDMTNLLSHEDPGVCENAIWFIANITGSSTKYRDALFSMTTVMDALLYHMNHPANISMLSTCAWAISSLFLGQSSNVLPLAIHFVPAIVKNVSIGVKGRALASELQDLMAALLSITECCAETCTLVLESGLLPILIDAISYYHELPNTAILLRPMVQMIWQFSAGTEQQTEQVILSGFLNCALKLLQLSNRTIQKVVLFALSNVAAGSHSQIDSLLKQRKLVKEVVRLAAESPAEVKKQALWTMSNIITEGSVKQANYMVCHECIAIFCNVLEYSHDSELNLILLAALETLLTQNKKTNMGYIDFFEHCNGIQTIEDLQSSKNEEVYKKVVQILVNFFGGVEDDESCDDQNMAPIISETQTTYEFGTNVNEVLAKQLFPENVEMAVEVVSTPLSSNGGATTIFS